MRRIVNDGMDIQGGSGICLGPSNYLGRVYQVIPVGITVEGANILTRTMMIFGQGAIRCHPYIQQEMAALHEDLLPEFDALLGRHSRYFLRNLSASLWLGLSNARFQTLPGDADSRVYYRQITRLSAAFAMYADFALMTLGGALKRKERLSGLFADALSYLYLASCVLKHYQDQGCQLADTPLLHWACQHSIYQAQQALRALFWQLPLRPVAWVLRACAFPLGKAYPPPNDKLTRQTANLLLADSPTRDRLSLGIYINQHAHDATGRIELAFAAVLAAAPTVAKLKRAQKLGQLGKGDVYKQLDNAVSLRLISPEEAALCVSAQQASLAAIAVDDFDR